MRYIIYTGIEEDKSAQLLEKLQGVEGYEIKYLQNKDEVISFLSNLPHQVDLVLICAFVFDNPIKLAQKINSISPEASILILTGNNDHKKFKQSLQFTPFINNHTICLPESSINGITDVVKDLAKRAMQRRSFASVKNAAFSIKPENIVRDYIKKEYLDVFLDEAPVGALLTDQHFHILALNQMAKSIFEVSEKEVLNLSLLNLFSNKISKEFLRQNLNVELEIEKGTIKTNINGKTKFLRIKASKIKNSDNQHNIIIISDISDLKYAEEREKEKVKQLKLINEELEQFAYIVSHDLKNPIGSINLSCSLAEEEEDQTQIKEHLHRIKNSTNHLLQLIYGLEELIDVKKNESEHFKLINFIDIFNSIYPDFQLKLEQQNGKILTNFSEAPDIIYIEAYLTSIFSNLISNSIKYHHNERPVEIQITTQRQEGFVILNFKDNGIGIDMKNHGHELFQPFRRLTEKAEGKGVGLSIIKSMISKNGGYIEVKSKLDEGTEFICFLKEYNSKAINLETDV